MFVSRGCWVRRSPVRIYRHLLARVDEGVTLQELSAGRHNGQAENDRRAQGGLHRRGKLLRRRAGGSRQGRRLARGKGSWQGRRVQRGGGIWIHFAQYSCIEVAQHRH